MDTRLDIAGPNGKAARLERFAGHSMYGGWEADGRFWVYSYSTPIAVVDTDGTVYVNERRYSTTSSGHLSALAFLRHTARYQVDVHPDGASSSDARRALTEAAEWLSCEGVS